MSTPLTERELKRSSASLLVLGLLDESPRHGYEIGKLIEVRSNGTIRYQMASLYPLLYRLEARGWIEGRWTVKAASRRRRQYRITAEGRRMLTDERTVWQQFVRALDRVVKLRHA
ncbi:MAG TPA: helix-turn-helix transcriptional regulator [Vicinamibacterales bacterium]|jgi:transcriptional regulator|nr:helix-turn-helix transcriptional regulator [Vicinamibacterales bacterium]